MTIKSMTAFAKAQKGKDNGLMTWEIRSVNNRFLDISLRLPPFLRALEPKFRTLIKHAAHRGKIECTLHCHGSFSTDDSFTIHRDMVEKLHFAIGELEKTFEKPLHIHATEVLHWPGVMHPVETDQTELQEQACALLTQTLAALDKAKTSEGQKLRPLFTSRLTEIKKITQDIRKHMPHILNAQRERILTKFEEAQVELDRDRLEQEMVFIAQKADIDEELDRLAAHVKEVQNILKQGGAIGRRLDFLMQELNREANTLGSKSVHEVTTKASIELKVLIEQMREQVQNIE